MTADEAEAPSSGVLPFDGYEDVTLIASRQLVNIYRATHNVKPVVVKVTDVSIACTSRSTCNAMRHAQASTGNTVSSTVKYKITNEYELGSKINHPKYGILFRSLKVFISCV